MTGEECDHPLSERSRRRDGSFCRRCGKRLYGEYVPAPEPPPGTETEFQRDLRKVLHQAFNSGSSLTPGDRWRKAAAAMERELEWARRNCNPPIALSLAPPEWRP